MAVPCQLYSPGPLPENGWPHLSFLRHLCQTTSLAELPVCRTKPTQHRDKTTALNFGVYAVLSVMYRSGCLVSVHFGCYQKTSNNHQQCFLETAEMLKILLFLFLSPPAELPSTRCCDISLPPSHIWQIVVTNLMPSCEIIILSSLLAVSTKLPSQEKQLPTHSLSARDGALPEDHFNAKQSLQMGPVDYFHSENHQQG